MDCTCMITFITCSLYTIYGIVGFLCYCSCFTYVILIDISIDKDFFSIHMYLFYSYQYVAKIRFFNFLLCCNFTIFAIQISAANDNYEIQIVADVSWSR